MPILLRPAPSNSFRSWRVIAGSLEQQLCVQERTAAGLQKNRRMSHRLFYRRTDFARYRIIRSTNSVDYDDESMRGELREADGNSKPLRLVLAVSENLPDILRDWERVKGVWGKGIECEGGSAGESPQFSGELHTAELLTAVSQHVSAVRPDDEDGRRGGGDGGSCVSLTPALEEEEEEKKTTPYGVSKRQQQQPKHDLDLYDICIIRVIGIWQWRSPVESLAYMTALLFSWWWWCGMVYWPILCLLTLCAGFPWRRQMVPFSEAEEEEEENGKKLQQMMGLLSCQTPRRIVSFTVIILLLEFVGVLFFPSHWKWVEVLECAAPPFLVASLVYTGTHHRLSFSDSLQKPPLVSPTTLGEVVALRKQPDTDAPENTAVQRIAGGGADILPPLSAREKALREEVVADGPFSNIVQRTIEFASLSNGWVRREERESGLVVLEKCSLYSNKPALLLTARVPGANVGTLQHLLLDDPTFEDRKNSYAYHCDKFLGDRLLVKVLGWNEAVVLTRHKSIGWGTAPREFLNYISSANLFTPAQQEALGLRTTGFHNAEGKDLMAFAQCGVQCPYDAISLPPSLVSRKYQRGVSHIYLILGLEEEDGSLTLRICFDVDLCGDIPRSLQDFANRQHILKAEVFLKFLGEIGQMPNIVRPYVNMREFVPLLHVQPPLSGATQLWTLSTSDKNPGVTPTVTDDAEVLRIAKRFVQELLQREWDLHSKKNGVSLWTTKTPWTDKRAVKTVVFIPNVRLKNVDAVVNDLSLVSEWNKYIKAKTFVREVSAKVGLFRTTFHSPSFGIAARDMVTRVVTSYYPSPVERATIGLSDRNNDGMGRGCVFLHVGEDAADELPTHTDYQRGRAFLFGALAEEVFDENGETGVRLTQCAAADPGGSLPAVIINTAVRMQSKNAARFAEIVTHHATAALVANGVPICTSVDTSGCA